jgi:outer membrane protein assembly factor BamB
VNLPSTITPAATASWTTYQDGSSHLGDSPTGQLSTPLHRDWTDHLDGSALYGQPLLYGGRVFVATEDDDVFALDASNGRTLWETRLGSPLLNVAAQAGCGDVDPLGVTSTPVIDTATGTLYVLGELSSNGRTPVHHELFGVDLQDGEITSSVDADPPLASPQDSVHLLQRAALALGNGRVYVGFGGQYGDCGSYHGWVVSIPVAGGSKTAFDVTPNGTGGAVWDGGSGPAIGHDGDVFVTTGNPNSSAPAPWAESVVKLPSALSPVPLAYFRDRAATGDMDLSTGGPILLPDGDVFAVGKTDIGYLLRQADLSQVAPISGRVCSSDPDGGGAWDPVTDSVYVPCRAGGIQQVDLSTMRTGWRSGSANSTVVRAGAGLWSLRYPTGTLEELDPSSGAVLYKLDVGQRVANFASPTVIDGLVVVPTASGVVAFSGA